MKHTILGAVSLALIVASGIVHGYWTERWAVSASVAQGAASVELIPYQIGDWRGEPLQMKGTLRDGIAKQEFRRYRNTKTGDVVTVALVCGRPGPVCIHTPDVCYDASGYAVGNKTDAVVDLPDGPARFFTADAVKTKGVEKTALRIFWGWGSKGQWKIKKNPRWEFEGGRGVLYKLYVIRDLSAPTELKTDPCTEFLRQALPVLNRTLFMD